MRQLVGLGHHRRTSLLQDLRARQVGGFCGEVGVQDTRTRGGQVFRRHLQVADRGFKARLQSTELGTLTVDEGQALAGLAQRTMRLQCTIQEGLIWLGDDERQVELKPEVLFDEAQG